MKKTFIFQGFSPFFFFESLTNAYHIGYNKLTWNFAVFKNLTKKGTISYEQRRID